MKKYLSLLILLSLSVASAHSQSQSSSDYWVYFGTYTGFVYMKEGLPAGVSRSKGIYVSKFHPATGELTYLVALLHPKPQRGEEPLQ